MDWGELLKDIIDEEEEFNEPHRRLVEERIVPSESGSRSVGHGERLYEIGGVENEAQHERDVEDVETLDVEKERPTEGAEDVMEVEPLKRKSAARKALEQIRQQQGNGRRRYFTRRRRCRVDRSLFRLTEYVRKRKDGDGRLPSEKEWMLESCRIGEILTRYMNQVLVEVPYLRCINLKEKGRKLISVAPRRVREEQKKGGWSEVVVLRLMVGQSRKDVITFNLKQKNIFFKRRKCS